MAGEQRVVYWTPRCRRLIGTCGKKRTPLGRQVRENDSD